MVAALLAGALAGVAVGQGPGQAPFQTMPAPTPEADQLVAAMRRVGENPRDLDALLTAGELSLRLGDAGGAASLFKRAEAVDPTNGRVKAGMARILVTQERPGEALRYFDQAIGFGLDPRTFAGDRGLAYDLIGEQERAQRDYRLALKMQDSDEVRRRYALSLGISGRQEQALAQIEPLVRRNDRGAWRARAFILAMTGDVQGANAIATGMMPPNMAQGLAPFLLRLSTLPATDRAFAVHFGEIRPTPERLADARLTPALPTLGPDPDARAAVAIKVPAVKIAEESGRDRRRRLARERRERMALARAERRRPARVAQVPAPTPAPVAPAASPPVRTAAAAPPSGAPQPGFDAPFQRLTLADSARAARARARTRPDRRGAAAVSPAPAVASAAVAPPSSNGPAAAPIATAPTTPTPVATANVASPPPPSSPAAAPPPAARAEAAVSPPPAQVGTAAAPIQQTPDVVTPAAAPVAAAPAAPPSVSPAPTSVASAVPPAVSPTPPAVASAMPVSPQMSEDSILSRIVAGIAIPGYELGVGSPPPPPPPPPVAPETAPATLVQADPPKAPASAEPPNQAPAPTAKARARLATKAEPAERTRAAARSVKDSATADAEQDQAKPKAKRGTETAKSDIKAKADPKKDDKAKPDEKSAKVDKKARAKPEPKEEARIWVQVSGGAFAGDLPKAWATVKAKAPALAKRDGYATPLRATNRVVTGPFKSEAEAQALVNQLSKQGVSAFTFKSSAGQKVTRLPAK